MAESTDHQCILDWLATAESAMIAFLEKLVNIDSGSYDKAGVDAVGEAIEEFLKGHSIDVRRMPIEDRGDTFRADVPAAGGNRPIMLLGHRDTVFPKGEADRRPFKIENGRAYGPGVADMKAGLVMNAFVLAAFKNFGGAPAPLIGLFTGDEEIGSPTSRSIIEETAREAAMVFNLEPGLPSGNIINGRKGGVFFTANVEGVAAHSGGQFEKGRSAIEELARKIQAWHGVSDLGAGITVNVGLISGGQSVNTVAPYAEAQIDLRYISPDHRNMAVARIEEIATSCSVEGTRGAIAIAGEFAPLTQTPHSRALLDLYVKAAAATGLNIGGEFSGGCADSGFTAAVGAPTVCAVGPVGGNVHTPEEYLEIATIVPRAQTLARAILAANST